MKRFKGTRWLLALAAAALLPAGKCSGNLGDVSPGPTIFRLSVGTNGIEANGASTEPDVTSDGRYVVFASTAKNLAPPVSPWKEIFLRDRVTGAARNMTLLSARLSQSTVAGQPPIAPADCSGPVISDDGKFVAFLCAGDLISTPGIVHPTKSVYLVDIEALQTDPNNSLFSLLPVWPDSDVAHLAISGDGSKVVFSTAASNIPGVTTGSSQVYAADRFGSYWLISRQLGGPGNVTSNGISFHPEISKDGLVVAFCSNSTDLTLDPTGGDIQVFVSASDATGPLELVSRGDGNPGVISDDDCFEPSLSADGRYVSFLYNGSGTMMGGPPVLFNGPAVRRDRVAFRSEVVGPDSLTFDGILTDRTHTSDDGRWVSYLGVNPPALTLADFFVAVRDMDGALFKPPAVLLGSSPIISGLPNAIVSGDGRWFFWSSEGAGQVIGDTNNAYDVFGYGPLH